MSNEESFNMNIPSKIGSNPEINKITNNFFFSYFENRFKSLESSINNNFNRLESSMNNNFNKLIKILAPKYMNEGNPDFPKDLDSNENIQNSNTKQYLSSEEKKKLFSSKKLDLLDSDMQNDSSKKESKKEELLFPPMAYRAKFKKKKNIITISTDSNQSENDSKKSINDAEKGMNDTKKTEPVFSARKIYKSKRKK